MTIIPLSPFGATSKTPAAMTPCPSTVTTTMPDTCAYIIDSLGNARRRGKGNRPWWRRSCKRVPVPGSVYCWQHKPIGNDDAA